eukprot:6458444-Amphidinium_carterae.1
MNHIRPDSLCTGWHSDGESYRAASAMPLSKRALKGFTRVCPELAKDPCPWELCCQFALDQLGSDSGLQLAVLSLLCFDCYLRPGEAVQLHVSDIVLPARNKGYHHVGVIVCPQERGTPAKNREFDDTFLVGSIDPDRAWLALIVSKFAHSMRGNSRRFPSLTLRGVECALRKFCLDA